MMKMKRYIYMIIAGLLVLGGCKGEQQEQVLGPEETVEAFCRAVAAKDMDRAMELCDTVAMKGYIDGWTRAWEELEQKDSSALRIASGMLTEAAFTVVKTEKAGDDRMVTYTLETGGKSKTRRAIVRKEEGEWRVAEMTDVQ